MSICSQAAPTFELRLDVPSKQHLSVAKALTGFALSWQFAASGARLSDTERQETGG